LEGLKAQSQPLPTSGRVKVDKRPKREGSAQASAPTNPSTTSNSVNSNTTKKEQKYENEIKVSSTPLNSTSISNSTPVDLPSKQEVKQESRAATQSLVVEATNEIIKDILSAVRANASLLNDEENFKDVFFPQIQFTLNSLQNQAYAEGFASRLRHVASNI